MTDEIGNVNVINGNVNDKAIFEDGGKIYLWILFRAVYTVNTNDFIAFIINFKNNIWLNEGVGNVNDKLLCELSYQLVVFVR